MKYTPGDICLYDPALSLSCLLIMEVERENPEPVYSCLDLKNRLHYSIKESKLAKIGVVTAELGHKGVETLLFRKPPVPSEDDLEFLHGRARAKRDLERGLPIDRARWQILANAKPGDVLKVHGTFRTEDVTFHYVLERGEKFVFSAAKDNNKVYRFTLASLCLASESPQQ